MTREQTQDFLAMIQGAYLNFNPPNKTVAINAWKMALEDYEERAVHMAFKMYMHSNTSGFAPVPGQIIDNIHKLTEPQELNEMEAWSLVSKAIRNSGYNSSEEFSKLPQIVQKAVGLPDQLRAWALDEHYNEGVARGHFINCYKLLLERKMELQKMPKSVQDMIETVNRNSYNSQIEKKRQKMVESASDRKQEEIKALEVKHNGVPMPEKYKEILDGMGNEQRKSDRSY